jgi:hypothetical protein
MTPEQIKKARLAAGVDFWVLAQGKRLSAPVGTLIMPMQTLRSISAFGIPGWSILHRQRCAGRVILTHPPRQLH